MPRILPTAISFSVHDYNGNWSTSWDKSTSSLPGIRIATPQGQQRCGRRVLRMNLSFLPLLEIFFIRKKDAWILLDGCQILRQLVDGLSPHNFHILYIHTYIYMIYIYIYHNPPWSHYLLDFFHPQYIVFFRRPGSPSGSSFFGSPGVTGSSAWGAVGWDIGW